MASSGWQGSQYIYTVYSEIWGNLRIDGITHSGTDLRVWGALRIEGKGSGCSYFNNGIHGYTESQSDALIVGGGVNVCSGNTFDRSFDVTIHNVSTSTTSYNFDTYFYACNANNCSSKYFDVRLRWTISFSASGSGPSGAAVEYISSTWNSVKIKSSVSSWGSGYSGTPNLEQIVVLPTAVTSNWMSIGRLVLKNATSSLTSTNTVTNDNSIPFNGGITIKGASEYKIAAYASTSIGESYTFDETLYYTPPAPGQLTYAIDPNDDGRQTISYVGVPANNDANYNPTLLKRTVRYKGQNDANWTYVENNTQIALNTVTTQLITIPASTTTTVQAWMTYNGLKSKVSTVSLTNNQDPVKLYCSMGNKAEQIEKLYGRAPTRVLTDASIVISSVFTAFNSATFVNTFSQYEYLYSLVAQGYSLSSIRISYFPDSVYRYQLGVDFSKGGEVITKNILASYSLSTLIDAAPTTWGVTISSSYSGTDVASNMTGSYGDHPTEFSARKIRKLYASVNGVTKLIYRDSS